VVHFLAWVPPFSFWFFERDCGRVVAAKWTRLLWMMPCFAAVVAAVSSSYQQSHDVVIS